jgi:hypothetical protein
MDHRHNMGFPNNVGNGSNRSLMPFYEWGEITPEEITQTYKQVRSILNENRVIFMTASKGIHGCMQVLKTTPEVREMLQSKRAKRVGDDEDTLSNSDSNLDENQIESRDFGNECVARVVSILLDQYSHRVDLRYQKAISQALLESVEVARYMMTRNDSRSAGIDIILQVLDSTKHYYAGSDETYYNIRTNNAGLRHVLDSCIRTACRTGTFEKFSLAIMAESGTSSTKGDTNGSKNNDNNEDDFSWWRGSTQLLSLFQIVCDVNKSRDSASLKKSLLPALLRWGTACFLSLPDKMLKKEDTEKVAGKGGSKDLFFSQVTVKLTLTIHLNLFFLNQKTNQNK